MKGKTIGNATAIVLTLSGVGLMLFRKSIMSSGPVGDGGIYGLFGIILIGVGVLLP